MPLGLGLMMGLGHNVAAGGGGGGGPTAYRAFRLNMTTANGSFVLCVAEFIIATTLGGSNAISAATMTASSTFAGQPASLAVDGDISTFWNANGVTAATLVADLGATTGNWIVPAQLRLVERASHGDMAPKNFTLEATTGDPSGSPTWTTILADPNDSSWDGSQTAHAYTL
jgi:hypothetical protein